MRIAKEVDELEEEVEAARIVLSVVNHFLDEFVDFVESNGQLDAFFDVLAVGLAH